MKPNDRMREELKKGTANYLRQAGFKGSFPNFRRVHDIGIDLIRFQFAKFIQPYFVVEYGYTGRFTRWHGGPSDQMAPVTEKSVIVIHLHHPDFRGRLHPQNIQAESNYPEYHFDFSGDRYAECDAEVQASFAIAELWFKSMRENPAYENIGFTGTRALLESGKLKILR